MIVFSILMTSLTHKSLILQWEVWLRSLLGLKGLIAIRNTVFVHIRRVNMIKSRRSQKRTRCHFTKHNTKFIIKKETGFLPHSLLSSLHCARLLIKKFPCYCKLHPHGIFIIQNARWLIGALQMVTWASRKLKCDRSFFFWLRTLKWF